MSEAPNRLSRLDLPRNSTVVTMTTTTPVMSNVTGPNKPSPPKIAIDPMIIAMLTTASAMPSTRRIEYSRTFTPSLTTASWILHRPTDRTNVTSDVAV